MTASDKYEIAEIVRNELIRFHAERKQKSKWVTFHWKYSFVQPVYAKGPEYLATSFNEVTYYFYLIIRWKHRWNRVYLWKTVTEKEAKR
jgi:hypothetical protein